MDIRIYYVGRKAAKKDTLTRSGVIWNGYGDSKLVPEQSAQKLLNHPSVWVDQKTWDEHYAEKEAPAETEVVESTANGLPILDQPPAPETATEPNTLIKEAIRKLDRTNPEHFTGTGAPKIAAVRAGLPEGFELAAKELNAVFDEIKDEFRAEA